MAERLALSSRQRERVLHVALIEALFSIEPTGTEQCARAAASAATATKFAGARGLLIQFKSNSPVDGALVFATLREP